jgi:hypothetical protein
MRGVWLTRTAAAIAVGKSQFAFNREVLPKLKMKKKKPTSHPLVFLPVDMMKPDYVKTYEADFIELDDDSQQVEDVIGDVTNLGEVEYTDPRQRVECSET